MVNANTLRRYQQVIDRIGYDQARQLAETQDIEEIRVAFNAKPTTADTTLLAYQRILRNLVNQANNPDQANQRVLRRIERGWSQEIQELRETIERLNQTVDTLNDTIVMLRDEMREREQAWKEEKEELLNRIKALEEQAEKEDTDDEDDLGLEDENGTEDIPSHPIQIEFEKDYLIRDLSYERTAVDGTKIKHFKRELNFSQEKTSNDIINNADEYSDYVYPELEEFVKSLEYVKIYVNLVNENGQGITQSLSNGFVATKDLELTKTTITDLIVDCASKSTSGNKHSSLTINATGF